MKPVISINNLSKQYCIGTEKPYKTFRETLASAVESPASLFKKRKNSEIIWALKDVSFDVKEGEVIGIIGRNGSGKSTLLKILSRITEPTSGEARIRGRVGSLLEVGTGFHPELTGRENIFLNGAILGMSRQEIRSKFDEIVAFSEIEKFIDTPVKRYSSGMYVRLAFAVAAHLEPEILIVDEVLAVGDISFQKKCLGKMGEAAKGGRTVLFVSHNMSAVRTLCENAIWLDNGQIVKNGPEDEIVRGYEESQIVRFDDSSTVVERNHDDVKNLSFYIKRVEIFNVTGEHANIFKYNDKFILIVEPAGNLGTSYSLEFRIWSERGEFISVGASGPFHDMYFDKTTKKIRIEIGPLILTKGKYSISLNVMTGTIRADTWDNSCSFHIIECRPFTSGHDINARGCVIQQSFSAIEPPGWQ